MYHYKFPHRDNIIVHFRYRDDGFICYSGNIEEIKSFFEIGNSIHKLLKFTFNISQHEMTFLDTTAYKGERFNESNILDFKSYIKPTNSFQYLHRESSHPTSVFKGFIKGECIRHLRNTSSSDILQRELHNFNDRLIERGYSEADTTPIIQTTLRTKRSDVLKRSQKWVLYNPMS